MKSFTEILSNLDENWRERIDTFLKSDDYPQYLGETLRALRDLTIAIKTQTKEKGDAALARALGIIPSSEAKPRKKRRKRTPEEDLQFHRDAKN